jgi:solute carrier family 25 thiamine pyrophosphate transporter 19
MTTPMQVAGLQRSTTYGARVPRQYASSLPKALAQIWRSEGLGGLYKGALPSVLKAAPQAAVTFSGYEFFLLALTTILHTRQ